MRTYQNGIKIATGLEIEANTPVDDRMVVPIYSDLLASDLRKYDGLQIYVQSLKTYYSYDQPTDTWKVASTPGSGGTIDENTRFISIDNIEQNGGSITLTVIKYKINGVIYTIPTYSTSFSPTDDDYFRIDILVGNTSGQILKIQGVQSQSTPSKPVIPPNTVEILQVNIFEDYYSPIYINPDDFLLKRREAQQLIHSVGDLANLSWNEYNTYRYGTTSGTSTINSMNSTGINASYMYDGRLFTFIHAGGDGPTNTLNLINLSTISGVGNLLFSFPNQAINTINIFTKGDIIVFKYSILSNKLELVSINKNNGNNVELGSGLRYDDDGKIALGLPKDSMNPEGILTVDTSIIRGGASIDLSNIPSTVSNVDAIEVLQKAEAYDGTFKGYRSIISTEIRDGDGIPLPTISIYLDQEEGEEVFTGFFITHNNIEVRLKTGMYYSEDVSSINEFNDRWIVDKGYVDSTIGNYAPTLQQVLSSGSIGSVNNDVINLKSFDTSDNTSHGLVLAKEFGQLNGKNTTIIGSETLNLISDDHPKANAKYIITAVNGVEADNTGAITIPTGDINTDTAQDVFARGSDINIIEDINIKASDINIASNAFNLESPFIFIPPNRIFAADSDLTFVEDGDDIRPELGGHAVLHTSTFSYAQPIDEADGNGVYGLFEFNGSITRYRFSPIFFLDDNTIYYIYEGYIDGNFLYRDIPPTIKVDPAEYANSSFPMQYVLGFDDNTDSVGIPRLVKYKLPSVNLGLQKVIEIGSSYNSGQGFNFNIQTLGYQSNINKDLGGGNIIQQITNNYTDGQRVESTFQNYVVTSIEQVTSNIASIAFHDGTNYGATFTSQIIKGIDRQTSIGAYFYSDNTDPESNSNGIEVRDEIFNKGLIAKEEFPIVEDLQYVYKSYVQSLISKQIESTNISSFPIVPTSQTIFITYNGTTTTSLLPTISSCIGIILFIINDGTGAVTLNSNTGSNDIWEGGSNMATYNVPMRTIVRIINDGIKFRIL